MTVDISNSDNVIDSRDVIARIKELEAEREQAEDDPDKENLAVWDEDNLEELDALKAMADEAEGYAEDWKYGATLIRESYFVDYCQELCKDCYQIPKDLPRFIVIDWDATANNLRADYTDVDFDGATYLVR